MIHMMTNSGVKCFNHELASKHKFLIDGAYAISEEIIAPGASAVLGGSLLKYVSMPNSTSMKIKKYTGGGNYTEAAVTIVDKMTFTSMTPLTLDNDDLSEEYFERNAIDFNFTWVPKSTSKYRSVITVGRIYSPIENLTTTDYDVNDVVKSSGSYYSCIQAYTATSTPTPASDGAHWKKVNVSEMTTYKGTDYVTSDEATYAFYVSVYDADIQVVPSMQIQYKLRIFTTAPNTVPNLYITDPTADIPCIVPFSLDGFNNAADVLSSKYLAEIATMMRKYRDLATGNN